MKEAIEGKLVISICAGVTLAQLRSWVPASTEVVRAMPNTPCKVSYNLHTNRPMKEELQVDKADTADPRRNDSGNTPRISPYPRTPPSHIHILW